MLRRDGVLRPFFIALTLLASPVFITPLFSADCGKEGRAACKVWERFPPGCDAYLVERRGKCVHPPCGRLGQRPCTVNVRIPSCDAGLIESKADAILRDQLLRASVSVVLNLSEGAGRRSRADKARFYSMARGSASESGAILHLLRARGVVTDAEYAASRRLIVRIVQMLSKLAARTR